MLSSIGSKFPDLVMLTIKAGGFLKINFLIAGSALIILWTISGPDKFPLLNINILIFLFFMISTTAAR